MTANRYIAGKIVRALVTVWLVITITFLALHLAGDPITALVGDQAPQEVVDLYRHRFGLDQPLWEQYLVYFANLARGDFGLSIANQVPATELIMPAIPKTLELGLLSLTVGLLLGLVLGIIAAIRRNTPIDRFVMGFAVFGFSIPNFFLGISLILLFVLKLRLLPASGSETPAHFVMPMITLATGTAGTFARFTRSAVLEELNRQFMTSAAARGVPFAWRLLRYALPNAGLPIITILGLKLGEVIAGSVVVETVFAWPGMGRLLVNSVIASDFAVVQAILILAAIAMVIANLAADLVYAALDPRLRSNRGAPA